ncbi:flavin reductase [Saccharothrix syringae]|uniref:Flavin reductase n=2 Tax=Saccharothrix syringae TaxID=103733 RepID=A0A5Q0HD85_SACSY|nr:flavin reductase [Saccharothrix syringae]
MARFPTGVAVVTARDEAGEPHGMTVSSFCSVSLEPPLVLVCLARTARSFPVFARRPRFAVSVLRDHHAALAVRFARRGADKFTGGGLRVTPSGAVVVEDALAVLECAADGTHDGGDHLILVGRVERLALAAQPGPPAVYFDRAFGTVARSTGSAP